MNTADVLLELRSRGLFHLLDAKNIPSVKKLGGLMSLEQLERRGTEINGSASNDLSKRLDRSMGLHRYVHLSIAPLHSLGRIAVARGSITDPVILKVSPDVMFLRGACVSLDIANKKGAKILPWDEALKSLDFEAVFCAADQALNRKDDSAAILRYEFLVPNQVGLRFISM